MVWAPSETNRQAIKFWLDCLQVVTVVLSVGSAALTYYWHKQDEQARAVEQSRHEKEQLANVQRELRRPYEEKQLNLYLDAARVLAHLASNSPVDQDKAEARFWELYWGELAFVESPAVKGLMVDYCKAKFGEDKCAHSKTPQTEPEKAAIDMATKASAEIRTRWGG